MIISIAWNENLTYDIRGNITALTRTGKYKATPTATCWTDGQIDNLSYTYNTNTNRLQKIADAAPAASKAQGWHNTTAAASTAQYSYDVNGNMTADPYKGAAIEYNFLNLPRRFVWANASTGAEKIIEILYDGSGRKLRKTVSDNGILLYRQDYMGGIEYRTTSTVSLSLESIYHTEGRVFNTNTGTTSTDALRYEYTIRDHLGNTRLTFTDKNSNGKIDITNTSANEILQENHYYPFGMVMNGPWMDDVARNIPYQYNGKELIEDFGLNWNDYGFRWYDASVARWWSVDPLSEEEPHINGYSYVSNSPFLYVDPLGLSKNEVSERSTIGVISSNGGNGDPQCPDCIKKGEIIPGTGVQASVDEVEIVASGQVPASPDNFQETMVVADIINHLENEEHERLRQLGYYDGPLMDVNPVFDLLTLGAGAGTKAMFSMNSLLRHGGDDAGRYAYRALTGANAESLAAGRGISAWNPSGSWTLEKHLISGSSKAAKLNNPWIATSSDIAIAKSFNSGNGIVRIDLSKISNFERGWMTLPRTSKGYHYSIWQQEISIFGHVPQNAIKIIK